MDIVLDFDWTCASHDFPNGGFEIPGASRVVKRLVENGHRIVLCTMRSDKGVEEGRFKSGLTDAVNWFIENDIELYGVQTNPSQKEWTDSPKAYGHLIIDDAALGIPLTTKKELSDRQFVDWDEVEKMLVEQGVLG